MRRCILLRENKTNSVAQMIFFPYWQHYSFFPYRSLPRQRAGWVTGMEAECWLVGKHKCLSPEPELAFTLSNSSDRRPRQNHFSLLTIHTLCGGLNNGPQICPYPCTRNLGTLPSMARGNVQVRLWILKWDEYPELFRCLSRIHLS